MRKMSAETNLDGEAMPVSDAEVLRGLASDVKKAVDLMEAIHAFLLALPSVEDLEITGTWETEDD